MNIYDKLFSYTGGIKMILLILSFILMFVSNVMKNNPPKEINSYYGFRTKKSMKNEESWQLAQKLSGDFSRKNVIPVFLLGILFLSIEIYVSAILKNENFFVGALIVESLLLIGVLCSIIYRVNKQL